MSDTIVKVRPDQWVSVKGEGVEYLLSMHTLLKLWNESKGNAVRLTEPNTFELDAQRDITNRR
jgi:hypothetical protein